MACNYYYKGHLIGNELQLADFLLTKLPYIKKFGDTVFQFERTDRANSVIDKLESDIQRDGQLAHDRLRSYVSKHGIEYDSTGRVINLDPPAMGVNKFLQKYTHTEGPLKGHRIVPEFIKEEFWSRKINNEWKAHIFNNEDEKELICEIQDDKDFITKVENNEIQLTDDMLQNWADKIQQKWDTQGKIGTALHAVAEMFFSKNGGHYKFEELEQDPNLATIWYNDQYKNDTDEYGKIKFGDFVNFQQFNQMIEMCKKLKKQLELQYGEGLAFYPEFTIASNLAEPFTYTNEKTGKQEQCKEIIGIIDLLVVDSKGRTHIFDFKTSPKEYAQYSTAKERGFTYQLAVYDRILQHYGIYTGDGDTSIIPIQLTGFKYNYDTEDFTFDNVSYEIQKNGKTQVDARNLSVKGDTKIEGDIDEFLPTGVKLELYADNLLEKTQKMMHQLCPTYHQQKNMDDVQIREMIEKAGGFKPDRNGDLVFKFNYGFGQEIRIPADEPNQEAKMFKKVKDEIESWPFKKQRMVEGFVDSFNTAVRDKVPFEYKHALIGKGKQDSNFITKIMTPYCNGDYTLLNDEAAQAARCLGIVLLQNKLDSTITVLKLTGAILDFQHEFIPGRTNMNGKFAPDIEEESKGNTLMLKAINANIEATEALVALQNMESNYKFNIREVKVLNPRTQKGMPVSNKELLYTFKNLMDKSGLLAGEVNRFKGEDASIKMLTDAERLRADFQRILSSDYFGENTEKFDEKIRPAIVRLNALDWNDHVPKEQLYAELNNLRIQLENIYESKVKPVSRQFDDLYRPENQLYNQVMAVMLELKGVNVRQQIKDSSKWLEHINILKYGMEGLMLENAGNFKSQALNQLTKSVGNVYQKVRDAVNKENVTVRHLVENLKKEKNFGWIRSNISGNQTDMYKNMTYVDSTGDFLFVNPDTLSGQEKKFLEHALEVINKNRWDNYSDETLQSWKQHNDPRYYRVPLMRASFGSELSSKDMLNVTKERLKSLSPKQVVKDIEERVAGIFDEEAQSLDSQVSMYEMNNLFEAGESDIRERMLATKEGADRFEHDIEKILLAHCNAYELKKQMGAEMPIIKAIALNLSIQGAGANTEQGNFNNVLEFIEDYIKSVVKNQSIVEEKYRKAQAYAGKAKQAASFLALAFSPIQFTYQSLEGLWKNCALIIRKPDGSNAFTAKNMWEAAKSAYKDLAHFSDTPTKCQLLNETYGLNDMDSNSFTERINSDKGIWTHFTDFAFRMSSRPDYYNRLTIWGAQMRGDGTWDAHEVVNGELVYNFSKDKRYAALKTHPKNSQEYKEAYSKYLAALQQFKLEGVTNPDGSELKIGDDLPRAYTNQEAQGMKAIADNMYGYYNHENKSMMGSLFLGSLAMQMKTYWSSKKNQYFAPEGPKLMGRWEDYKENGEQLYYQVDDKGEIDLQKPFVREGEPGNSGVKVQKWKGQWQEGIFRTLTRFVSNHYSGMSVKENLNDIWWNPDPNLRRAYRSNLKHLLLDMFFFAVVGNIFAAMFDPWEEEEKKQFNQDPSDMGKACSYAAVSLLADSFRHSFMDFNFFDSIFSPTINWQPFAFSSMQRTAGNIWDYITTDKSFASTVANSSAALRQAKPILKCISYNEA